MDSKTFPTLARGRRSPRILLAAGLLGLSVSAFTVTGTAHAATTRMAQANSCYPPITMVTNSVAINATGTATGTISFSGGDKAFGLKGQNGQMYFLDPYLDGSVQGSCPGAGTYFGSGVAPTGPIGDSKSYTFSYSNTGANQDGSTYGCYIANPADNNDVVSTKNAVRLRISDDGTTTTASVSIKLHCDKTNNVGDSGPTSDFTLTGSASSPDSTPVPVGTPTGAATPELGSGELLFAGLLPILALGYAARRRARRAV